MPKWMASGEYQTSTSVRSTAGRPSAGSSCEKPVSRTASAQAGSSSTPSTTVVASMRGTVTSGRPRPSTICGDATAICAVISVAMRDTGLLPPMLAVA